MKGDWIGSERSPNFGDDLLKNWFHWIVFFRKRLKQSRFVNSQNVFCVPNYNEDWKCHETGQMFILNVRLCGPNACKQNERFTLSKMLLVKEPL